MRAEQIRKNGKLTIIYEKDIFMPRANAFAWFYDAAQKLPLENKMFILDNRMDFFEEPVLFKAEELPEKNEFVQRCVEARVYRVKTWGKLKDFQLELEVNVGLKNVYITCPLDKEALLIELERSLDL